MIITDDTICAVSTPPGTGGIAVIRISGKRAVEIVAPLFRSKTGRPLTEQPPYTLSFGQITDQNRQVIDEVLLSRFVAPHSFTGEDTIEITCHGSLYIQQQIIELLIQQGCRAASPGEFTQRAFLNGKMDLSQAEAVADLIAAASAASHRLAINQMRGGFSRELSRLRRQLLDFVSLIELELDFSEEEVEFADRDRLRELASGIEQVIRRLTESFRVGNAIKNGIPVTIIGETNAGKSTLLNRLLHEERAIVSEIHGTTRDSIEDTVNIEGITFRFIDTAGIRDTADKIENMGIELTYRKLSLASVVLWIVDAARPLSETEKIAPDILSRSQEKNLILILNKSDLIGEKRKKEWEDWAETHALDRLFISARENRNLPALEKKLVDTARLSETGSHDVIVTNIRHYEALQKAHESILRVCQGLDTRLSGDFLAQDIRECMHYIGEITGEISTDDILKNIFGKFCIGK